MGIEKVKVTLNEFTEKYPHYKLKINEGLRRLKANGFQLDQYTEFCLLEDDKVYVESPHTITSFIVNLKNYDIQTVVYDSDGSQYTANLSKTNPPTMKNIDFWGSSVGDNKCNHHEIYENSQCFAGVYRSKEEFVESVRNDYVEHLEEILYESDDEMKKSYLLNKIVDSGMNIKQKKLSAIVKDWFDVRKIAVAIPVPVPSNNKPSYYCFADDLFYIFIHLRSDSWELIYGSSEPDDEIVVDNYTLHDWKILSDTERMAILRPKLADKKLQNINGVLGDIYVK